MKYIPTTISSTLSKHSKSAETKVFLIYYIHGHNHKCFTISPPTGDTLQAWVKPRWGNPIRFPVQHLNLSAIAVLVRRTGLNYNSLACLFSAHSNHFLQFLSCSFKLGCIVSEKVACAI